MSITVTLSNYPDSLSPVNAPLWFRVGCTYSTYDNFKYTFRVLKKIEPFSTTSYSSLGIYKIPPRVDGYGIFTPNRILRSSISDSIYPTISGWTFSYNSLLQYCTNYGIELNPGVTFSDTISVSGNLGFTFSTPSATLFEIGDVITIDKTNKIYNPGYDGTCSISSIINNYSIKTDKTFDTSSVISNESGSISLLNRWVGTSSNYYTWNGTRQYTERSTDFSTIHITNGKFLTNYSGEKKIQTDDYETLSFIFPIGYVSGLTPSLIIKTYDINTTLIGSYTYSMSMKDTDTRFFVKNDVGVGPMNLSGITWSGVDKYDAFVKVSVTQSEVKTYKIDNKCSLYNKKRLCFLNSSGGWDYFNFTLDSKRMVSIDRTEYEKNLDWNYNIGDRGKSILSQKIDEQYTINSDWITENESIWLEELLCSPDVYVLDGSNKLPIIIQDKSYEVKTYLRNQLFNLQITYKHAYPINIQNE